MSNTVSQALLKQLISFDTTSYKSNLDLIYFVQQQFEQHGIRVRVKLNDQGNKACLFASVGPQDVAGVLLSGHSDVVPVDGQDWHSPPFVALEKDNKIYGRGTADMKGFIACAMAVMLSVEQAQLKRPLHLCISYDEEIGCIGVRDILPQLAEYLVTPLLCIVGEPTLMQMALGHKGKSVFKALCHGQEGHSALAPHFSSAIHAANALMNAIINMQQEITQQHPQDADYDIPYTTLHIGKIHGGQALNIVPNECIVDYEIRHIAQDSSHHIQQKIAASLEHSTFKKFIHIEEVNNYSGLATAKNTPIIHSVKKLLPESTTIGKISFGTEGGLFFDALDCPVLVCGPASIEVAHKPNEYIELSQLQQCDVFLEKLVQFLKSA
ncbi:acetylornithine deacetylase [Acinetobacter rathckeae]|uniref:acetylornithine deacetylase n=1 Tax=Acinetobacter rathckeae TaxID=2605272 RepID=UPI0018A2C90A|nr:acetylornithine deacetylase [Acinetobacter rathckeae]MBF7688174.1 acetylornithine deacetylase [Acinetobacter rathckeae]MBF7695315.1 acetylornithine deacetylase [Acinetobacter rathckeae]